MRCQICDSITDNFRKNPKTGVWECICDNCKRKIAQEQRRYLDITSDDIKEFIDKGLINDNNDFDEGDD